MFRTSYFKTSYNSHNKQEEVDIVSVLLQDWTKASRPRPQFFVLEIADSPQRYCPCAMMRYKPLQGFYGIEVTVSDSWVM